jgi:hypothetical protein
VSSEQSAARYEIGDVVGYLEGKELRRHIDDALTMVYALEKGPCRDFIVSELKTAIGQIDQAMTEAIKPKRGEKKCEQWSSQQRDTRSGRTISGGSNGDPRRT